MIESDVSVIETSSAKSHDTRKQFDEIKISKKRVTVGNEKGIIGMVVCVTKTQ